MSIKLGTTNVKPQGISKVYLGTDLVYQAQITNQELWFYNMISVMTYNSKTEKAFRKLIEAPTYTSTLKAYIPFNQFDNMIVRSYRDTSVVWYVDFLFFNGTPTFTANYNNIQASSTITGTRVRFDITNEQQNSDGTWKYPNSTYSSTNSNFTISGTSLSCDLSNESGGAIFDIIGTITNVGSQEIWGYNMP